VLPRYTWTVPSPGGSLPTTGSGKQDHMYGRWFLITFFWIGVVALLIAASVLSSPLIALAIAAVGIIAFLLFSATGRARQGATREPGAERPSPETKRGGAPASGEGGS
jgi:threonine/homoserine/homoserine lactone efflux protein